MSETNKFNKTKYNEFVRKTYVQIYSQPWWMDAVCGQENWDVWVYEKGGEVIAAMPYYLETRGKYRYITKAPLTQNNGVLIKYPPQILKCAKKQSYEEEIISAAIAYINSLSLDVYEQQFPYSFTNFLPFYWNDFTAIPRVTYVIEDTSQVDKVEDNISSKYKNQLRKGEKSAAYIAPIDKDLFYTEHEKIFARQGLPCPFSKELWERLYQACKRQGAGRILTAQSHEKEVLSLAFLVWDEHSMYLLLGGEIPEFSSLQTYMVLVREGIRLASARGLKFDFEGSMIRRINHSFREYGGTPKLYYRIRKVFLPEIIRQEAEKVVQNLGGGVKRYSAYLPVPLRARHKVNSSICLLPVNKEAV